MEEEFDIKIFAERLQKELDDCIVKLEEKIAMYGSFNIIANTTARNHFRLRIGKEDNPNSKPTIPEYVALVCLKTPFSLGTGEFMQARAVPEDFYEINKLADKIINNYTFLHLQKYKVGNAQGGFLDFERIAQAMSSEELLIRNQTFESFHWDLIEELYVKYDDALKEKFGLTTKEAIRLCLTLHDYIIESFEESLERCRKNSTQMYEEIIAYKLRNKVPKNFYPPDYLQRYKQMKDNDIRSEFQESMMTYEMVIMGDTLSFTAKEIAEMEGLELHGVNKFLDILSLKFGDITPDFTQPEIVHPLKDKPLIKHEDRFICPSISLLDYSLDRIFSEALLKNNKLKEKYKQWRHEYLLKKGMQYINTVINPDESYTNLTYPGGEMDGLILCDSNIFFLEAKGHKISDRAKKGFIDRIEKDIKAVIEGSYKQAIRTYNYLFGKNNVEFSNEKGKKVIINAEKYTNAYFITLTLDDFSTISCNLKVNNSFGLFSKDTFPWIVSLYNLRAVCDHMEGPAYFIQYLHRRKEFFKYEKFSIQDELDLLWYYLKQNLRFDELIKKIYDSRSLIHLEANSEVFDHYYNYIEGKSKREVHKMIHYTAQPIKTLVKVLADTKMPYSIDAGVQLLEFGSHTKKEFITYIGKLKKRHKKDDLNHDFRIAGTDVNEKSWMFSYWVGPNQPEFFDYFEKWIYKKFAEDPSNTFIAILDVGKQDYVIARILHLQG